MSDRWDSLIDRLETLIDRAEIAMGREASAIPPEQLFATDVAYRWESIGRGGRVAPVNNPHMVDINKLVGIDDIKSELLRNTAQFVAGVPANDLLLWGERGTGKSSLVKGIIKEFSSSGLRMIEVQRHDLLHLPLIAGQVRGLSYRFIIFCDDLSFAAGDASYQELKTLLDGGIEARPDNLLIYATSNRRHLLPEQFSDNLDSEIHPEEAVADKLSLADRFGLSFGFYSFDEETYLEIVDSYARLYNLTTDREELHREAIGWAIYRGQRSGRAAQQFAADMAGREWMGRQND